MSVKRDEIITLYSAGRWTELLVVLERNIQSFLEEGNEVQLARNLIYFGIIHLYSANFHQVSTIYKQIDDEYARQPNDVRIRAQYARFLAMYHTWNGDYIQAHQLFQTSLRLFEETDWYADEAIVLLENIYWLCLLTEERVYLLKSIERLKVLPSDRSEELQEEITIAEKCMECLQNDVSLSESLSLTNEGLVIYSRLFLFAIQCLRLLMTSSRVQLKLLNTIARNWKTQEGNYPICALTDFTNGLIGIMQLHTEKKEDFIPHYIQGCSAKMELYRHPWFLNALQGIPANSLKMSEDQPKQPFHLTITIFNSFTLQWGDITFAGESWGTKQERELFLYILLKPDGKASKDMVMEEFFSGIDPKKSSNRLYVAIHRINRSFQKIFHLPKDFQLMQIHQGLVVISQDILDEVDVNTYQKLISVGNQLWNHNRKTSIELMNKARKLFSTNFLSSVMYLDWLTQYRDELMNRHGKAMRKLARHYFERGETGMYEEIMTELLELQPLHEELYVEFIQYLLRSNKQKEANYWYRTLEQELDRELGLAPSLEVQKLMVNSINSQRTHGGMG